MRGRVRLLSALLAAAAIASCAYYNIYWMARDEYKKAMSDPEVSDFWNPFTQERLTGENARLITSVTKRCGKILLLYPNSKWVDDALLLMGNCYVLKQEYVTAVRKYDELINLYSESNLVDQARYMRAYTLILQDSQRQALTELAGLIAETDHPLIKEKAVYLRGRVYLNDQDYAKAITELETYISDFPAGKKVVDVKLDLGACLLKTDKPEEAIEVLKKLAARPSGKGLTASLQIGRARRQLGEYDSAVSIFNDVITRSVEDTLKARARIETAGALLEEGRTDDAIQVLTEADSLLVKGNPDIKAEINYRIGMIHEKYLGDFDGATAAYARATGSQSEFTALAAKKTQAINDMRKYQEALSDSIPDSPEDRAQKKFLLAEIYLEDLGLRDKALKQYRSVADSFPASPYTAKSMLSAASLLDATGDTLAREYYRAVIDSFPNTVYANLARSGLGLPLEDIVMESSHEKAPEELPTVPVPEALRPREPEIPTVVVPDSLRAASDRRSEADAVVAHPDVRRPRRHPEHAEERTWEIGPPPPPPDTGGTKTSPGDTLGTTSLGDTLGTTSPGDTLGSSAPGDTLGPPEPEGSVR
jgi:TolA-binding protein